MNTLDFDYNLPEELIAQVPAPRRDDSRLLVLDRKTGEISHSNFKKITGFLSPGDLLVLNNSKVIPARLHGHKELTRGRVEILLNRQLKPYVWEAIGKGLKVGAKIKFGPRLSASVLDHDSGTYRLFFSQDGKSFFQELERIGQVPLPPYVRRRGKEFSTKDDQERYQTVYAKRIGSVAAPTAGLHFTPELLNELKRAGILIGELTLHVGLGTFMPIKTEDLTQHKMHKEYYNITSSLIEKINSVKASGGRVIAVGTTSARVLETMFSKPLRTEDREGFEGTTDIFIHPPFEFKALDGLITNFHLPKSTLLMLVSALAGKEKIARAYDEAIRQNYRFFSYGDAMLIV